MERALGRLRQLYEFNEFSINLRDIEDKFFLFESLYKRISGFKRERWHAVFELQDFFSGYKSSRLAGKELGHKIFDMSITERGDWLKEKQRPWVVFADEISGVKCQEWEQFLFSLFKFVNNAELSLTLVVCGTKAWKETLGARVRE